MAIDRFKNLSDSALLGKVKELAAAERRNADTLRGLAADLSARNLPLPESLKDQLEALEDDDAPLDGVTALPDGSYHLNLRVSREAYRDLLEIGVEMPGWERNAGRIVEWAFRRMVELLRENALRERR